MVSILDILNERCAYLVNKHLDGLVLDDDLNLIISRGYVFTLTQHDLWYAKDPTKRLKKKSITSYDSSLRSLVSVKLNNLRF